LDLEFVHITKTGGTSIENAAANIGVAWGVCKFFRDAGCVALADNSDAPPIEDIKQWACDMTTTTWKVQPWHCPPRNFKYADMYYASDTFAIVRNPYDRIVSEYYWASNYNGRRVQSKSNNPNMLNGWIQESLEEVEKSGICMMGHCIPMHKYTHRDGKKIVDHVLHLENITAELPILLEKYGLDAIQLGHHKARKESDVLDASHLTNETISRINQWARLDFQYFGYDMVQT